MKPKTYYPCYIQFGNDFTNCHILTFARLSQILQVKAHLQTKQLRLKFSGVYEIRHMK